MDSFPKLEEHVTFLDPYCLVFAGHCSCPTSCDTASAGEPGMLKYSDGINNSSYLFTLFLRTSSKLLVFAASPLLSFLDELENSKTNSKIISS